MSYKFQTQDTKECMFRFTNNNGVMTVALVMAGGDVMTKTLPRNDAPDVEIMRAANQIYCELMA